MKKVDYLKKDLMYGHTQDFNLNLLLSRERALLLFAAADLSIRSEERRVGKECT